MIACLLVSYVLLKMSQFSILWIIYNDSQDDFISLHMTGFVIENDSLFTVFHLLYLT